VRSGPIFVLVLAVAGCVQPVPTPAEPPAEGRDLCVAPPFKETYPVLPLTHYVGTSVSGGSGGGASYDLHIPDLERLEQVEFVAEWGSNPAYLKEVRLWFQVYAETIRLQPWFEGPSPLHGRFQVNHSLDFSESMAVQPRAPRNYSGPATAQLAVIEQPVNVTFAFTYRC
jgi:hypothetical protein